jgi:hypothetical protein
MSGRSLLLIIILGTIMITGLRGAFPELDSRMISFIDSNILIVCASLLCFLTICIFFINKRKNSRLE